MADNMKTNLIIQALRMAIKQRRPAKGLLHHSDWGSQYTSYAFERELKSQGIRASFTSTGACLDNAYIEHSWGTGALVKTRFTRGWNEQRLWLKVSGLLSKKRSFIKLHSIPERKLELQSLNTSTLLTIVFVYTVPFVTRALKPLRLFNHNQAWRN